MDRIYILTDKGLEPVEDDANRDFNINWQQAMIAYQQLRDLSSQQDGTPPLPDYPLRYKLDHYWTHVSPTYSRPDSCGNVNCKVCGVDAQVHRETVRNSLRSLLNSENKE